MITIRINGEPHEADDPSRNLLSFIRFDAGLTGGLLSGLKLPEM